MCTLDKPSTLTLFAQVISVTITIPELQSTDIKLAILNKIILEARADGDERWKEAARQAEILNEQRSVILKAQGNTPPPTTIKAKVGTMGAKGRKNG